MQCLYSVGINPLPTSAVRHSKPGYEYESRQLFKNRKLKKVKLKNIKRGDLVFYGGGIVNKDISNYLSKLSKSEVISKSNDPYNFKPKLIPHNNNYDEIAKEFLNDVKTITQDINNTNTAILFRQKNEIRKLFKSNTRHIHVRNMFKDIQKDLEKLNKNNNRIQLPHFKNIQNYTENVIKGEYYLLHGDLFNGFKEFEKAYIKTELDE